MESLPAYKTKRNLPNFVFDKQKPVDHMEYRGYLVDYYEDPYGKQVYTFLDDKLIEFGTDNTMYADITKKLIDRYLDVITEFTDDDHLAGARLEWFSNGGNRDIRLMYWNRLLRVYVATTKNKLVIDEVIDDAKKYLYEILPKEN